MAELNLVPPSEPSKTTKEPKAKKEPKPKKEKVAREPGTPKNMMNRNAIIRVDATKEVKYRGQRLEWFDRVKQFEGKTVADFSAANKGIANGKGTVQAPGGWLSFYVRDKSVILENPPAEAPPAA